MFISEERLQEEVTHLGDFIGNTPLFPLNNILQKKHVTLYAKLEWQQFGGSVKARPAFNIIKNAIENGELDTEKTLLDASSGNTAIAYATIGASLNIPVTICLPSNASKERKMLLKALGAEIIYTSEFGSTDEAQHVAMELYKSDPGKFFYADQYNNPNNWKAHYHSTAEEIIAQTKGEITHFITGLGTTGSFSGTGKRLKEYNPAIELIALQPDSALHLMEGWKHLETAKVPGIYHNELPDRYEEIDSYEALEVIRLCAAKEGLILSPSSAANLTGALKLANEIDEGVIVTLFPDSSDKYSEIINGLFLS